MSTEIFNARIEFNETNLTKVDFESIQVDFVYLLYSSVLIYMMFLFFIKSIWIIS
jgi:hypothetical protein